MPLSDLPVIGFVAPSGSGKTTLLRSVVSALHRRGLRVGYLKHAHHSFDLDIPGKDSYEIRDAGASQTLLASRHRWALQAENADSKADPDLGEMLGRFERDRLDLILVEGFKHARYDKIEVYRAVLGQPALYPADPDIVAVATNDPLPRSPHPEVLPLGDPDVIAEYILALRRT